MRPSPGRLGRRCVATAGRRPNRHRPAEPEHQQAEAPQVRAHHRVQCAPHGQVCGAAGDWQRMWTPQQFAPRRQGRTHPVCLPGRQPSSPTATHTAWHRTRAPVAAPPPRAAAGAWQRARPRWPPARPAVPAAPGTAAGSAPPPRTRPQGRTQAAPGRQGAGSRATAGSAAGPPRASGGGPRAPPAAASRRPARRSGCSAAQRQPAPRR